MNIITTPTPLLPLMATIVPP